MLNKIEENHIIKLIKPFFKDIKAYIVGGFVRDLFLDKTSPDIDLLVCNIDVEKFSKEIAEKLNAHFIELDPINKIYRVVLEDKIHYLDITTPIENNFEKDIKRRDLTINAIAYDLNNGEIIDLVNGVQDIKKKVIKGISEQNFIDDPLRLLRIFRFFAKTGFEIDNSLIEITKKYAKRINEPAKERITVELLKMFEGKYTDLALLKLDEVGLLCELFPIYNEVKKVPKNTHHHLDLFHHLVESVTQLQIIYENANEEVKNYLNKEQYGAVKQLAFLKLAGFLHDVGKPSCWTIDEDTGRHRFIQHDLLGSELCVPILQEFKFSKKQIEYVKTLIKYHMYASAMLSSNDVTDKAYMRFYRKMEGFVIDVILIGMADRLSARGELVTEKIIEENISGLTKLLNDYLEQRKNIKPLPKLIDGNEIMHLLGLKQGKELGIIISALKEEQISGNINTKEEAIEFINSYKKQKESE